MCLFFWTSERRQTLACVNTPHLVTRDQLFPLKKKKAGLDGANISHDANLQPQQDTELQTAQKTMIYWPNPKSSPPPAALSLIPPPLIF